MGQIAVFIRSVLQPFDCQYRYRLRSLVTLRTIWWRETSRLRPRHDRTMYTMSKNQLLKPSILKILVTACRLYLHHPALSDHRFPLFKWRPHCQLLSKSSYQPKLTHLIPLQRLRRHQMLRSILHWRGHLLSLMASSTTRKGSERTRKKNEEKVIPALREHRPRRRINIHFLPCLSPSLTLDGVACS